MKNQVGKYVFIIVLVLFVMFGIIFYWFAYRPSKIREYCVKKADEVTATDLKIGAPIQNADYYNQQAYSYCLRSNGMN